MKRRIGALVCFFLLLAACGGSVGPSDGGGQTAKGPNDPATGEGTPAAGGGAAVPDSKGCCAPDPTPGCCMKYGGSASAGGCGVSCDGMPVPSDPGWKLVNDAHGCPQWTNPRPYGTGGGFCGGVTSPPPVDGGADASRCPASWYEARAFCGQPCTDTGASCSYAGAGDVPGESAVLACHGQDASDGGRTLTWVCGQ